MSLTSLSGMTLVALVAAVLAGCGDEPNTRPAVTPTVSPSPSPSPAPTPAPTPSTPMLTPMPSTTTDYAWLATFVDALATRAVTLDETVAFFGTAAGPSAMRSDWVQVTPHAALFRSLTAGPMAHVAMDVRVESELATPVARADLERVLGEPLRRIPPNPHGDRTDTYAYNRHGPFASVRVFVGCDRGTGLVVTLEIDATPLAGL